MIVTCMGCDTSFNLQDERVKKTGSKVRCSKCKNIFMVYPPVIPEEQDNTETIEKQETEVSQVRPEGTSLSDYEDLNFSEVDEAIIKEEHEIEEIAETGKGEELFEEEEIDFSDLSESLEKGEVASTGISEYAGGEKSEISDSEDIDFSELEKMLENGEINFDSLLSEDNKGKLKFSDTEEIDLSEIDAAIDNFEDIDTEDTEEDIKELKLDFGSDQDSQISKIKNAEEVDFSDLENTLDSEKPSDSRGKNDETEDIFSDIELDPKRKPVEQKSEEESDELDFSDLEKMLETETGAEGSVVKSFEETAELSLELEQSSDSRQDLKFEDTVSLEEDELDFSDFEKILDSETGSGKPFKELSKEDDLELSLEMEDQPSDSRQADYFGDTATPDEIRSDFPIGGTEPEDIRKDMEEFRINKFQDTVAIEEEKINTAIAQESNKDRIISRRAISPPVRKNFFSRFLLVFGIIVVLLIGLGAFVYYKPLGLEIPFISGYLESKTDKSGNLKITPLPDSLKGDFIDTKSGTLFVITGKVRNDYKYPRSNIKVTGKVFKKGKVLYKAESVFCGNVISGQDLSELDPGVFKRRLQNRFGDNKSNMSVKPGSTVPFMVVFENPSPDLDEFIVEAESSIKG